MSLILALLLAQSAPSGGVVTRGSFLKQQQYQTGTAAMTFFVDTTGSDANSCTASGVNACATLTGVFNKLPRFVNGAVTINVARLGDGGVATYSEAVNINKILEANINVAGPAKVNATLATGSATGTLQLADGGTAVNDSHTQPVVVWDDTQSWTVNDLSTDFLCFTNGPANTGCFPIVSNTATSITLAGNFGTTVPVAGNAYAIQVPGAVFTSTTAPLTYLPEAWQPPSARPSFTAIDFQTSTASRTACTIGQNATFTNVRCLGPTGLSAQGGLLSLTRSVMSGTGIGASIASSNSVTWNASGSFVVGASLQAVSIAAGGNGVGNVVWNTGQGSAAVAFTNTYQGLGSSVPVIDILVPTFPLATSAIARGLSVVNCTSATGTGLLLRASDPVTSTGFQTMNPSLWAGKLYVNGCGAGVSVDHGFFYLPEVTTFNAVGTAITATNGAQVHVGSPWTINDAGTVLVIDGQGYDAGTLTGSTPARITNPSTGSSVWYN